MMKKKIIFIFLIVSLFLFMFTFKKIIAFYSPEKQELTSEKGSINVYFCPKQNCSLILEKLILSANNSVDCALYDLRLQNVIKALAKKSKNIPVRVVVDNDNYKYVKGAKQDDDNQLMHNKFCIIDKKIITTGSFNPTENDAFKNNNNFLIIHSKYLAENYEEEFKELWNLEFGKGSYVKYPEIYFNGYIIENYFCPEDNCKEKLIEEIKKSEKSIYFMTFSFTDEEIADAILFQDINDIKGVFDKMQASSDYSQYKRMKDFGLDVKLDKNKYKLHHKVFIIDNESVITGSYNPTFAGNFKNDENILIIHDKEIAKKFVEEFNSLFE